MFHESNPIARVAIPTGFRPLRALLKRLGGHDEAVPVAANERPPVELGFYALDDVACIRIRRR